ANGLRFDEFLGANQEKLDGLPVAKIVSEYGSEISPQIARRLIRALGIRPHDPESRWRGVDCRLTNRDLAAIWNTSPKYIANVRARLRVGPAQWDARSNKNIQEPAY